MWTKNFQKYKLDLEKAEESEIKTANIHRIIEKAREFHKHISFVMLKTLCGSQQAIENS